MQRERIDHLDVAKGIGIILVVIFHAWRGIVEAKIAPNTPAWLFADYIVYLFHMPLFFLIAGGLVNRSLKKGLQPYLVDKLIHVYYPYLLWCTVSLIVGMLLADYVNKSADISRILYIPLFPKFHYWFLFTLMIYYVIVAFIRDLRILLAIAVVSCLLYEVPGALEDVGRYLHFFFFFVAGMILAPRLASFDGRFWPIGLLVLFGYAMIGTAWDIDTQSAFLIPAGLAGTYSTIAIAQRIGPERLRAWLRLLGERSLAIYLLHILAASGTRIIVTRLAPDIGVYPLLAMIILAGIALPLLAYAIAERLGLLTLGGLGKDRRAKAAPVEQPA